MGLRKFRSAEEMPSPEWGEPLDPENLRRAADLSSLAARLHPRRFPAGVYRYRSVEEASAVREKWELHDATPARRS
jgi:hypothetical protein